MQASAVVSYPMKATLCGCVFFTICLSAAAAAELDSLRFAPAQTELAVVLRPGEALKDPHVAAAYAELLKNERLRESLWAPVEDIQRLSMFYCASESITDVGSGVYVIESTRDVDWKSIVEPSLTALHHRATPFRLGGYDGLAAGAEVFKVDTSFVLFVSPRLIITTDTRALLEAAVTAERKPPAAGAAWRTRLRKEPDAPFVLAFDAQRTAPDLDAALRYFVRPSATTFASFISPFWQDAKASDVVIRLAPRLELAVDMECHSPEAARRAGRTLEAFAALGGNMLREISERGLKQRSPALTTATRAACAEATTLCDSLKVMYEGNSLRATARLDGPAEAALRFLALTEIENRAAAAKLRSQSNIQVIMVGLAAYANDHNGCLPPAVVVGPDGKTPHSWRVALLPYLGDQGEGLFEEYRLDEAWDSPNNLKVAATVPFCYRDPGRASGATSTCYFALVGPNASFSEMDEKALDAITDDHAETIAVVEARREIPWTKPEDVAYDPSRPLPQFGGVVDAGFAVGFVNGSVGFVKQRISPSALRALISASQVDSPSLADVERLDYGE